VAGRAWFKIRLICYSLGFLLGLIRASLRFEMGATVDELSSLTLVFASVAGLIVIGFIPVGLLMVVGIQTVNPMSGAT
jgi:hypothetical protein